jgi:hypothetical protein
MLRILSAFLCALALASSQATARAATAPLDATLFPDGTALSYVASLSNLDMDCGWSLDCSQGRSQAAPSFHTKTEEKLGRQGGWTVMGTLLTNQGQSEVDWVINVSFFQTGQDAKGRPFTQVAFNDFVTQTQKFGVKKQAGPDLGAGPLGTYKGTFTTSGGSTKVELMAYATGDVEVESLVGFDPHRKSDARLAQSTMLSVHKALASSAPQNLGP